MRVAIILVEPVTPRRHQGLSLLTTALKQMQHPPWSPPTGAALRIAADRSVLIEKTQGLLQHGFRETQLGVGIAEVVHQRRGVAVTLEQTLQNPAHGQLQSQMLNGGLLKKGLDTPQTGGPLNTAGSHQRQTPGTTPLLAQSHFGFQERKMILGFEA
jgi:hypothetical protein